MTKTLNRLFLTFSHQRSRRYLSHFIVLTFSFFQPIRGFNGFQKIEVERITRHLMQGNILLQIEISMRPSIFIRYVSQPFDVLDHHAVLCLIFFLAASQGRHGTGRRSRKGNLKGILQYHSSWFSAKIRESHPQVCQ